MRLDADAVHKYLDPYGTDRRRHSNLREAESGKDFHASMKALGISILDSEIDDDEEEFIPDPLAKALATLLVEKRILSAEEVQKAFDKALQE